MLWGGQSDAGGLMSSTSGRLRLFFLGGNLPMRARIRGVGVEDLVDRIERRAAPVDAAAGHRKFQRALHLAGRGLGPVSGKAVYAWRSRAAEPAGWLRRLAG